jgi:hypothetical protein
MLNMPVYKYEYNHSSYFVHGTKFKELLNEEGLRKKNYLMDIPFFTKLPSEAVCRHTRNSNIKD